MLWFCHVRGSIKCGLPQPIHGSMGPSLFGQHPVSRWRLFGNAFYCLGNVFSELRQSSPRDLTDSLHCSYIFRCCNVTAHFLGYHAYAFDWGLYFVNTEFTFIALILARLFQCVKGPELISLLGFGHLPWRGKLPVVADAAHGAPLAPHTSNMSAMVLSFVARTSFAHESEFLIRSAPQLSTETGGSPNDLKTHPTRCLGILPAPLSRVPFALNADLFFGAPRLPTGAGGFCEPVPAASEDLISPGSWGKPFHIPTSILAPLLKECAPGVFDNSSLPFFVSDGPNFDFLRNWQEHPQDMHFCETAALANELWSMASASARGSRFFWETSPSFRVLVPRLSKDIGTLPLVTIGSCLSQGSCYLTASQSGIYDVHSFAEVAHWRLSPVCTHGETLETIMHYWMRTPYALDGETLETLTVRLHSFSLAASPMPTSFRAGRYKESNRLGVRTPCALLLGATRETSTSEHSQIPNRMPTSFRAGEWWEISNRLWMRTGWTLLSLAAFLRPNSFRAGGYKGAYPTPPSWPTSHRVGEDGKRSILSSLPTSSRAGTVGLLMASHSSIRRKAEPVILLWQAITRSLLRYWGLQTYLLLWFHICDHWVRVLCSYVTGPPTRGASSPQHTRVLRTGSPFSTLQLGLLGGGPKRTQRKDPTGRFRSTSAGSSAQRPTNFEPRSGSRLGSREWRPWPMEKPRRLGNHRHYSRRRPQQQQQTWPLPSLGGQAGVHRRYKLGRHDK